MLESFILLNLCRSSFFCYISSRFITQLLSSASIINLPYEYYGLSKYFLCKALTFVLQNRCFKVFAENKLSIMAYTHTSLLLLSNRIFLKRYVMTHPFHFVQFMVLRSQLNFYIILKKESISLSKIQHSFTCSLST